MDEMNIPLQDWINDNQPKEEMLWKNAWSNQVVWVRDKLPAFLIDNHEYEDYEKIRNSIIVISTHISKSIKLPVYKITVDDNEFILRNNFYDWKISANLKKPLTIDFNKLGIIHDIVEKINPIYCEGFKNEWVWDSYDDNQQKFTTELITDSDVMLFFWLISHRDLIWEKK